MAQNNLAVISQEDFKNMELEYINRKPENADRVAKPAHLVLQYLTDNNTFIKIKLSGFRYEGVISVSEEAVRNLPLESVHRLSSSSVANLSAALRNVLARVQAQNLAFTETETQVLYYPLTKGVAAGIIRAFYNGRNDPLVRIQSLGPQDTSESALLLLYYLSCIKFFTNISYEEHLSDSDNMSAVLDEESLVLFGSRDNYRDLKNERREIPANHICLHAVYGAYVLCRPVAAKQNFSEWIKKRYSALVASMQQTPGASESFNIQAGGNSLNALAMVRPITKRLIYEVIKLNGLVTNGAAVKTHIKMLTALSEMTTYSMINKVIVHGGSLITLKPLSEQILTYIHEKTEIEQELIEMNEEPNNIVYIHLIMPNRQCFKSTSYPDVVVTAIAMEKHADPRSRTIENYKTKIQNALLEERIILQFLHKQKLDSTIGIMSESDRVLMEEKLGINLGPLVDEAKRVLDLIAKQ